MTEDRNMNVAPMEPMDQVTVDATFDREARAVAGEHTTRTGDVAVPHADGHCNDRPCKEDGGCAGCAWITAFLPLTATVLRVRYYSNAGGPAGDHPRPVQVAAQKHDNWSEVYPHQTFTTPSNTVVRFRMRNWSHNRTRSAAMEVDWRD